MKVTSLAEVEAEVNQLMSFGLKTDSAPQSVQVSAAFANSGGFMSPANNYGTKAQGNDVLKVSDETDPPFAMDQKTNVVGSGGSKRRYEEVNETE